MVEEQPTSAPVVVTPIPAQESRTLRLTRAITWLTPLVAMLPDLIGVLVNLWMTSPDLANALSEFIPLKYRALFTLLIVGLAQSYGHLRRGTVAPISGTVAAESLPQATTSTQDASTKR